MFFSAKFFVYFSLTVSLFFLCAVPLTFADVNVNLLVEGCNNNNICESSLDENVSNCSNDCTPCNNNSVCEPLKGESNSSCPSDCHVTIPVPDSAGKGGGSLISPIRIFNVQVKTSTGVAVVSWQTAVPAFGLVQWGSNIDYSLGSIQEIGIKSTHTVRLENLDVGKDYFFKITSSLPLVYPAVFSGIFKSFDELDTTAPSNISNFKATPDGRGLVLSWVNPNDDDFAGVKILRSPFYFPIDLEDGRVVYDGAGVYTRDVDLKTDTNYFYTAYSYDRSGNRSSGALLKFIANKEMEPKPVFVPKSGIQLSDFSFVQNDFQLPLSSTTVLLYPFHDISVSVSKSIIPKNIKLIILEIESPYSDQKQLYKFYSIFDKERSILRMAAFDDSGMYPFKIKFIDYQNKENSEIDGTFNAFGMREDAADGFSWAGLFDMIISPKEAIALLLILVIFALLGILPLLSNRRS